MAVSLNLCQAGHETHDSKLADTKYGPFWIWDWEKYRGFPNYCTGQDDVSMSLDLYGDWERPDILKMRKIILKEPGVVLDFGAHIGWYAAQAAELCEVWAYDSDPENIRLLEQNLDLHDPDVPPHIVEGWITDTIPVPAGEIRFLKSDVEGAENEVINLTLPLWQNRLIDHALLEVSPVFKPYYPALVDELIGYGYDAYILKDEENWHITGEDVTFPQENVWFSKL